MPVGNRHVLEDYGSLELWALELCSGHVDAGDMISRRDMGSGHVV